MNVPAKIRSTQSMDFSTISGWGIDANPDNDPTYPFRDRSQDNVQDADRPTIQRADVEILKSIEYVRRPAVVGTLTPPRGISGLIRRLAFRWSESNWLHWLMLMGADRITVVEGVFDDLAHAHIPNIPAEMGIRAELQFNKRGFVQKTAIIAVVSATALGIMHQHRIEQRPTEK
jgi:hypothetical protein